MIDPRRLSAGALLLLGMAVAVQAADPVTARVTAVLETEAVDQDPDDPAIWVNPADPLQSRIIGTDKQYGLVVFDLAGKIVQRLPDGRLNNVDLRDGVMLDGKPTTLVVATRRDDNTLVFYTIDETGTLAHAPVFAFPGAPTPIRYDIYGVGLYLDPVGTLSVIVNFKTGDVFQWIVGSAAGRMTLTLGRQWKIPSQPEGVAGDDGLGYIYVGEEDGGIWRYPADPTVPAEGVLVDSVGGSCLADDDVEGLAVLEQGREGGYLVASAQGGNGYALYARKPDAEGRQPCIGIFGIMTGATDPVSETDGLEVTMAPLGPNFPRGLMVVMDDLNEGFTRNFKYVSWAEIETALGLPR